MSPFLIEPTYGASHPVEVVLKISYFDLWEEKAALVVGWEGSSTSKNKANAVHEAHVRVVEYGGQVLGSA